MREHLFVLLLIRCERCHDRCQLDCKSVIVMLVISRNDNSYCTCKADVTLAGVLLFTPPGHGTRKLGTGQSRLRLLLSLQKLLCRKPAIKRIKERERNDIPSNSPQTKSKSLPESPNSSHINGLLLHPLHPLPRARDGTRAFHPHRCRWRQ
jgi:hypothetical protein